MADRFSQSSLHNFDARALVALAAGSQAIKAIGELQQGAATAGDDAFFHSGTGGIKGILNAQFPVFEFGFGGCSHLDHGDAAGELGNPLHQLLAVVIRVGVVEFATDGSDPISHGVLMITASHNCGAVLGDCDAPGAAEVIEANLVEGHRLVFAHHGCTGEDGDVREHGLAAIAKARSPYRGDLEHTPVLVHHQGGKRFSLHFFGKDE